jgi:hypothetical protein
MSIVKGIKRGKIIELLEDINLPDGQEILIDVQIVDNFWSKLLEFRSQTIWEELELEEEDPFTNIRDKSIGRNINL